MVSGALLVITFVVSAVLFGLAISIHPEYWGCGLDTPPPEFRESAAFLSLGTVAFILGNRLGRFRVGASSVHTRKRDKVQTWFTRIMVVLLFLLVAILLGYETFGQWSVDFLNHTDPKNRLIVEDHSKFWPITWYVRCAVKFHPALAAAATVTASFALGHWLHVPRSVETDAEGSTGA
jgi:uncharacterized membrane protein YedE/YeeE